MIKKKALFKRLKNIEDKSEEQLQVIKDQEEKPRSLKILERIKQKKQLMKLAKKKKYDEANKLLLELRKIDETLDNAELVCTKTDVTKYDFNCFSLPLKFIENI